MTHHSLTEPKQGELNFERISPFAARRFLTQEVDLTQKEIVVRLYKQLLEVPIESKTKLISWLLDRSELEAACDQAASILYIRMTCQTDDPSKAQDYSRYIKEVLPAIKPLDHALNQKLIHEAQRFSLDEEEYTVYLKTLESDLKIYKEENISLQTQVNLLSQ